MATISTRAAFALAAVTLGSFALAACSSGAPAGETGSDETGSSSAPAEQEQETTEVLTTDELGALLEGAGLTLMPQDQVEQSAAAAGSATAYDSIEPAACEALFAPSSLLTDGATVAMGSHEATSTIIGAFSYPDTSTIDKAFSTMTPEAVAACPEYTATVDGQTVTGTVAAPEVTVAGADSAIALSESVNMSGMDLATTRVTASKGGVLFTSTTMGTDAAPAADLVSQLIAELP